MRSVASFFIALPLFFLLSGIPEISPAQSYHLTDLAHKYEPFAKILNKSFGLMVYQNGKGEGAGIGPMAFDEHTVFNIGSGTKAFTAILLLQEEEKGHLSLSDSIGKYLSPIPNVDGSLSIQTLLQHESGLGEIVGEHFKEYFFSHHDSMYQSNFIDRIPVGDSSMVGKYEYCNTNYILLGHVLEKVTDQNYFDLLRDRIFTPCGMKDSYPYVSKSIPNLAHPVEDGKDIFEDIDHRFFAQYAYSAGSIASTLTDMQRYYQQLLVKKTLLSPASLEKMLSFSEADYGLGIMKMEINGKTYYGHGGNNIGYGYRDYFNPETQELAMLFVNSSRIPFSKLLRDEMLSYLDEAPKELVFDQEIVAHFKQYEGLYTIQGPGLEMEVKAIDDQLYALVQGAQLLLVSHESNTLLDAEFGISLEVQPDNPEVLVFRQHGMETTAELVKN